MAKILFPTRGGKGSYPNQDWVIAKALADEASLTFLFVSNVRFLIGRSSAVLVDLQTELDAMGEFLLAMAQERAEKAGISAKAMVKHGGFEAALREVIADENITTLALGTSIEGKGITTVSYLEELAANLSQEFDLDVYLLQEGHPVQHFTADPSTGGNASPSEPS